jgi:maltodextrin utilization protein YvdJ
MLSKRAATRWLQVVLVAVFVYSIVLVVAGSTARLGHARNSSGSIGLLP